MTEGSISLHATVVRLAADPSSREDIAALVTACHRMAIAYLRVKSAGGHFSPSRFGLSLEDLAFDGIADLFARDASGTFPVIRSFVQRMGGAGESSSCGAEDALRRFVCYLVNRRIFDLYREFDPSLARIIRNIKLATPSHPDIALGEHLGEKVLYPRRAEDLAARLPVIAPELLQSELRARVERPWTLRTCLTALAAVLRDLDLYRRLVPLSQAALAVRILHFTSVPDEIAGPPDATISEEEIRALVERTLEALRRSRGKLYTDRGRLSASELDAHMRALQDVLLREFDELTPAQCSFFDVLRRHIPRLTPEMYAGRHRSIFEYLIRCARTDLAGNLEAEF